MLPENLPDYSWPLADEDVRLALDQAYRDGSWGVYLGPNCESLSADLCQLFGLRYAQLCSSGTIGVELALRGCGIGPGKRVALAGYDFPGNFRAIEAVGARPVLIDVGADSWSIDATSLSQLAADKVSAVIVSHLHGGIADMAAIAGLARERGWQVIEDVCQAPGAHFRGQLLGSWGHVAVLSFGGSKLLTAGRGGAVLTDDPSILQRMKVHSEQGNQAYPLSELQAAVIRPQLAKLDSRNEVRRQRVKLLRERLGELSAWLRPVAEPQESRSAYFKFACSLLPAEEDPAVREELLARLWSRNLPIGAGFRGFTNRGEKRCDRPVPLSVSEQLSRSTLLLHHPILLAHEKAAQQLAKLLDHEVRQLAC